MGRIRGKALKGINEEVLDVPMDGGSICGVTPPNAFRVKDYEFTAVFFNQG